MLSSPVATGEGQAKRIFIRGDGVGLGVGVALSTAAMASRETTAMAASKAVTPRTRGKVAHAWLRSSLTQSEPSKSASAPTSKNGNAKRP